jgi:hypothetical protein
MMLAEFWQCPGCKDRYWTLYPRQRLICQQCHTRCVPSTFAIYCQPDSSIYRSTSISIFDPDSDSHPPA